MHTTLNLYLNGNHLADCGPGCHDRQYPKMECICNGTNWGKGAAHAIRNAAKLATRIGRTHPRQYGQLHLVLTTSFNCFQLADEAKALQPEPEA